MSAARIITKYFSEKIKTITKTLYVGILVIVKLRQTNLLMQSEIRLF